MPSRHGAVRAVVGDQAGDSRDAVGSEEHSGAVEETDGRRGFFVLERFGVGEAGEPVDDRVEVGVADSLAMLLLVLDGASAMGPPPAAVLKLPTFLTSMWTMWPG